MKTNDTDQLMQVAGNSDECLAIDELVMAIEGERGKEAQARAEGHLAECAFCEAELSLFRGFEAPNLRPEELADVKAIAAELCKHSPVKATAPWWKGNWNFKILAPALITAAAVLTLIILVPHPQESRPGAFSADDTLRSRRIEGRAPIGNVNAVPYVLEWTAVEGASQYRVRLFEVDNTELWKTEVQTASVRIPERIRLLVTPRKKLNWQVIALDRAGNTVADSAESFTLAAVGP